MIKVSTLNLYIPTQLPEAAARVVAILRHTGHEPRWVVQRSADGQLVRSSIHPVGVEGVMNSVRYWGSDRFTIELKTSGYVTVEMDNNHVNLDGWLPLKGGYDSFREFCRKYYSERDF